MSAVTVTGFKDDEDSHPIITERRGNVTGFRRVTKGLVAIDTYGNEFKVPDFSIKDILSAIPKQCYERYWYKGMSYIFRDIFFAVLFGYAASVLIPQVPNQLLRGFLWFAQAVLISLPYTGMWVMAHECGHQAFSPYGSLNDTVGWILHSYLLVPYFSWKYSHGKHHKATGHMTREMVFVPATKKEFLDSRGVLHLSDIAIDAPISTLYDILVRQLGGWWAHLLVNASGQKYPGYSGLQVSHFTPSSPIFEKGEYWFIVLSDIGIVCQLFVLYQWISHFGTFSFFVYWFLPYIFTNHWLVFITYLQHTDMTLPHYEDKEWNFARGAGSTIDRKFGFIGPFFFHDIIETHVLHHYVSRIPFYNARIGSKAIQKVMGEHYRSTDKSMWKSLWEASRYCEFVDGDNGVLMFRNHNGLGVKPID
ncbi:DEKNAAC104850 [Brettanomyces naardenensis]|uniref:DEKNAAC104850 n=1 Tax=Brettanomyces naardenensis TaxID=13370 RepID=A0A448YRV6_BRENA|nr:DEKNAAC104850 [Brettanomyces naardenensis]